eukprot:6390464-Prymnesium_polylepis.1
MAATGLLTLAHHDGRSEYAWDEDVRRRAALGFAVRHLPGKGLGAVATRAMRAGQELMVEHPLFTIAEDQADITQRLVDTIKASAQVATQFRSLSATTLESKWLANKLPSSIGSASIYRDCCRLNHSCDPNVHHSFNARDHSQRLFVTRIVEPGDELTITYLTSHGTRAERRKKLTQHFGFVCHCKLCSLEGAELERSDARQRRMAELAGMIGG